MRDDVKTAIQLVEELKAQDISHEQLGSANGFQPAEAAKNENCDYFLEILRDASQHEGAVNDAVLQTAIVHVNNAAKGIQAQITSIARVVEDGIHTPQFPGQREGHIKNLVNVLASSKSQLHPLELSLRIARLNEVVSDPDALRQAAERSSALVEESQKDRSEIQKILGSLQDKVVKKGVQDARRGFTLLSGRHSKREFWWLVGFLGASAVAIGAIVYAVSADLDPYDVRRVIAGVFKRILLISAPAVFMKVTMSKYNLERHLRITYDHRSTVLDEYRTFEAAIGDDLKAKNQFRLEIAKYIFSDPNTGYVTADATGDISINPVVSTVEKIISGGGEG